MRHSNLKAACSQPRHAARPVPDTEAPETRNPKPETRNPKPETRDTKPETQNPKHETRNTKPSTGYAGQAIDLILCALAIAGAPLTIGMSRVLQVPSTLDSSTGRWVRQLEPLTE